MTLISLVFGLIISIISGIIFTYNTDIRGILNNIAFILVYLIGIYILFYKDGYRKNVAYDNEKILNKFIIFAIGSYVIYYLTGVIITTFSWTTFMLIHSPTYVSLILGAKEIEDLTFKMMNISFIIIIIPVFISSFFGFKTGVDKRKKDREKTTGKIKIQKNN